MKRVIEELNWMFSFGGRAPVYLTRLIKYASTGGAGFVVDIILLIILIEFLQVNYLVSVGLGYLGAISFKYVLDRKWGFKETKSNAGKGYLTFISFGVGGIIINVGIVALFVEFAGFHYLFSRFLSANVAGLFVFCMNYIFTFRMGHELPFLGKRKGNKSK